MKREVQQPGRLEQILRSVGGWVRGLASDVAKERRLHLYHEVQRADPALAGVASSAYGLGWDLYLNPAWQYPAGGRFASGSELIVGRHVQTQGARLPQIAEHRSEGWVRSASARAA